MSALTEYVTKYATRGDCECGRCITSSGTEEKPAEGSEHTVDLIFFKVGIRGDPDREVFEHLVREHRGVHCEVDLFDCKEHNYLELGGWIGDQGLAMMMMGLGAILGCWKLMTPRTMLPGILPDAMVHQMAGQGYVAIQVQKAEVTSE